LTGWFGTHFDSRLAACCRINRCLPDWAAAGPRHELCCRAEL